MAFALGGVALASEAPASADRAARSVALVTSHKQTARPRAAQDGENGERGPAGARGPQGVAGAAG
ncbi:MAG: hypothetical protein ACRDNB_01545, partial [Gaiellaceae bacterium]